MRKSLICALAALVAVLLFWPGVVSGAITHVLQGRAEQAVPQHSPPELVTLALGDYLLFGTYLGEPILWQVIALEYDRPLLLSAYVLSFKAFSTTSNDWQTSTLRQWLNSTDEEIRWQGLPPIAQNIHNGRNAYADEPGFLHSGNFSAHELLMIYDGEARVFLPSVAQLRQLPAVQRRRAPTRAALLQDDSPYLFIRPFGWYWTVDPFGQSTQSVRSVTARGSFYQSLAMDGMNGVVPALYFTALAVNATGGSGTRAAPFQVIGGAP